MLLMKGFLLILGMIVAAIALSGCTESPGGTAFTTPTIDQATRNQDLAFSLALNDSTSKIVPLYHQFSGDIAISNWTGVVSSGTALQAETEQQYFEMSQFAVSQQVHEIQANYLRSLQEMNQAADSGLKAASAITGRNTTLAGEYRNQAVVHLESAESYLNASIGAMNGYTNESRNRES
jgi:hypothetical protein